nr:MAG TPA: hypothetical protein [Siphoviridae sp. ctHdl3]
MNQARLPYYWEAGRFNLWLILVASYDTLSQKEC